jgi:hypothetical protein
MTSSGLGAPDINPSILEEYRVHLYYQEEQQQQQQQQQQGRWKDDNKRLQKKSTEWISIRLKRGHATSSIAAVPCTNCR